MTQIAKTGEKEVALSYFVEEQAVAMPLIVLVPAALAVVGQGEVANQLRLGFTHIFSAAFSPFGWVIGLFYAALGIFLSFIYLDRRENTFCMPLFSSSSLLSGIVASYVLMWWAHGPAPSRIETSSAFLLTTALLVMSPLHHLPLYIRQLKDAIVERRLVLLTIVKDDSESIPDVAGARTSNFITINLDAVRDIWRKVAPTR